jgi:predicted amino acid dehydrogenase
MVQTTSLMAARCLPSDREWWADGRHVRVYWDNFRIARDPGTIIAAAISDPATGLTLNPVERMHHLLEEIQLADKVGLDVFGIGETSPGGVPRFSSRCNPLRCRYAHGKYPPH